MPDTQDAFSRKLPFSLEAEQSVLGSILISPETFNDIAGIIRSDDFHLQKTPQLPHQGQHGCR